MDLVQIDKKSNHIKNLVDKYKKKTRISSTANYSASLPKSGFQPMVVTFIPTTPSSIANPWPVDKKIDQQTEMIQSLALFICTL